MTWDRILMRAASVIFLSGAVCTILFLTYTFRLGP